MNHPDEQQKLGTDLSDGGPLGGLDVDEQSLKKGKGRMLAGMILAGVGAVVALGLYLGSGGDNPYAAFGREVNGLDREHFAGFWGCVMQGYDLRRIKNDQDLRAQIHKRASHGTSRFGAYVRDDCLPRLAKLEPGLAAVAPPQDDDVATALRGMGEAVGRLRGGFSDFVAHLDGLGDEPYVDEEATDTVGRIARAWYDYRVARGELNRRVKQELDR
jgi:hypothetical protein